MAWSSETDSKPTSERDLSTHNRDMAIRIKEQIRMKIAALVDQQGATADLFHTELVRLYHNPQGHVPRTLAALG